MLTKHLQKILIAALIICESSSVAIAEPTPHTLAASNTPYQLKVALNPDLDTQPYQLEDQFQRSAKSASLKHKGNHTAVLVSTSPSAENPVAIFTTNDNLTDSDKLADQPYAREVALAAAAASVDPALVHAVIFVESHYRQNAVSLRGAIGLMQVLPDTAARYGIKDVSRSPGINIKAGTLYLRDLLNMFGNRTDLALAAYNAGEGAVQRYSNKIPPYPETQTYVRAVLAKYSEWRTEEVASGHKLKSDAVTAMDDAAALTQPHVEYLAGTRLSLSSTHPSANY